MARQRTPRNEADHQANVNQARHEPVPASRQDDRPQAAAQRSEEIQRNVAQRRRRPGQDDRAPALESLAGAEPPGQPAPAPPGAAAAELMGGPRPQGPVPDAPGAQVAAEAGPAAAARTSDHVPAGRVSALDGLTVPHEPEPSAGRGSASS